MDCKTTFFFALQHAYIITSIFIYNTHIVWIILLINPVNELQFEVH